MIVTRFAPSPTGQLHLGHAYSALVGHSLARKSGGKFRLRIEDLDQTRCRPEFAEAIYEDLRWLGLDWDEPLLVQSERTAAYAAALEQLRSHGLVFACFCTRADLAAALQAPHDRIANYPGTCRARPDNPQRRATMPHCWRLNSAKALELAGCPSWTQEDGRRLASGPQDFDDIILARKDAPAAYHLACVIDDATSEVTMVVRGADLRSSTPVQRLLQKLLDLPEPTYLHHPLVTHEGGRRLAKRELAPTLAAMRERGVDGPSLAADLIAGKLPLGFAFGEA